MSELVLSREQSRAVDKIAIEEFGIPGIVLMENAGRNVAELLLHQNPTGKVTILCGKGNNGGDGYVIARHLDNKGIPVSVIVIEDPDGLTGDAATNFAIMQKCGISWQQLNLPNGLEWFQTVLEQSDWVVDALLGTGLQGQAREPYLEVIQAVNRCERKILAVDVPSGLDSDSGPVAGATISAKITATFVALKRGLNTQDAAKFAGRVDVIDIGAPRQVLQQVFSQ